MRGPDGQKGDHGDPGLRGEPGLSGRMALILICKISPVLTNHCRIGQMRRGGVLFTCLVQNAVFCTSEIFKLNRSNC